MAGPLEAYRGQKKRLQTVPGDGVLDEHGIPGLPETTPESYEVGQVR